jgi:chromosome segregation ATPase
VRSKTEEYRKAEAAKKEAVTEYYANIQDLKAQLEKGSGWTYEQTHSKKTFMMQRDNFGRNLDNVKSVLTATRAEVERVTDAVQRLEASNEAGGKEISELRSAAEEKQEQARTQKARKVQLESRLHELQEEVASSRGTLVERERHLKADKVDIIDTEKQLRESKERMEKYLKEYVRA